MDYQQIAIEHVDGRCRITLDRPSRRNALSDWVSKLPRFAHELAEYAYTVPAKRRILRAAAEFGPDLLYERYAFGNAEAPRRRASSVCPSCSR